MVDSTRSWSGPFEATSPPAITDGEQRKSHNFWIYFVHALPNKSSDGFQIPFAAGRVRAMVAERLSPERLGTTEALGAK